MAGLQSGEGRMMIDSVFWTQQINVTDAQTDTVAIAYTAPTHCVRRQKWTLFHELWGFVERKPLERITNSVIGVSRPLVPDYGTTFHLDYGGRDLPLTLLKSL